MREWYLMNGTNESVSGYENDVFADYNNESFSEILESYVAKDLILYNHDLSESSEIRGIIQGSIADTQLKSMERTILCTVGTLKSGMYIYSDDTYWLVIGRPDNNGFYEKSTLSMCNWLLKWQNNDGDIVSRWAVIASASKYNDGEDGNTTVITGSDQFSIQVPLDDETVSIKRDIKFFIDYNSDDPTVYQLTNPTNVIYRYGENNGITNWIVKEVSYSPTIEDLEYGVCNYKEPTTHIDTNSEIIATITGSDTMKVNITKKYIVSFADNDGNSIDDVDYTWNIDCDFADEINQTIDDNSIKLLIGNENYEDSSFNLQIIINGVVSTYKTINIVESY